MDRRQQKTRTAIFEAFTSLLDSQNYGSITVQEIIDRANIGRSTFYAHFETKDALLKALCEELFDHIIKSAVDHSHTHGLQLEGGAPNSVFCHILQHLQENDYNILTLLSCESNDFFLRYFKDSMGDLVYRQFILGRGKEGEEEATGGKSGEKPGERRGKKTEKNGLDLPDDFLVNHISGSFVEMIQWWIKGQMKETPQQLDAYFKAVIKPIL